MNIIFKLLGNNLSICALFCNSRNRILTEQIISKPHETHDFCVGLQEFLKCIEANKLTLL